MSYWLEQKQPSNSIYLGTSANTKIPLLVCDVPKYVYFIHV